MSTPAPPPQPPRQPEPQPQREPQPHQRAAQPGPLPPPEAGVAFQPVDRRYAYARLLTESTFLLGALIVVLVVGFLFWKPLLWIGLPAIAAWAIFAVWLIFRQTRALGYAERASDLLVRHGIMFHTTSVVPYGRLQYVEVSSGPIERMFGLAGVELHTASASTDATIPGLPRAEAERLRDELATRGESQLAGL